MTTESRERARVRLPILMAAAAAWIGLVLQSLAVAPHHHHGPAAHAGTSWYGGTGALLAQSAASAAAGWALMTVAMMLPMVVAAVRHVRDRSFARRRVRAVTLFVGAYLAVWMVAGVALHVIALAIGAVAPDPLAGFWLAAIVAAVWHSAPARRRCLNRGHVHPPLSASGRAADRDVLCFGTTHGLWCVGSCWAWMLVPMTLAGWHVPAMALVAIGLWCERLERPAPERWALRLPFRAARILLGQLRAALPARRSLPRVVRTPSRPMAG